MLWTNHTSAKATLNFTSRLQSSKAQFVEVKASSFYGINDGDGHFGAKVDPTTRMFDMRPRLKILTLAVTDLDD
jgi:hypothetical protein